MLKCVKGLRDKTMLKEIGKTDSFDRMISALKYSIDQDLTKLGCTLYTFHYFINEIFIDQPIKAEANGVPTGRMGAIKQSSLLATQLTTINVHFRTCYSFSHAISFFLVVD